MRTNSGFRDTHTADLASTLALVDSALKAERGAVQSLVTLLTPAIRFRISKVLGRAAHGRNIAAAVDDVAQQVLLVLFANQGKVLRSWDPERRLSLLNFVGLVAERQALTIARSDRTNPFTEAPMEHAALETHLPRERDPESQLAARELYHEIADRMRMSLSPYAMHMFNLLFLEDKSVEQVSEELTMTHEAVYTWRSRLVRQARTLAEQILSEKSASPRTKRQATP
jgi:RNA polymerase sigma factor (sigma-70 family)